MSETIPSPERAAEFERRLREYANTPFPSELCGPGLGPREKCYFDIIYHALDLLLEGDGEVPPFVESPALAARLTDTLEMIETGDSAVCCVLETLHECFGVKYDWETAENEGFTPYVDELSRVAVERETTVCRLFIEAVGLYSSDNPDNDDDTPAPAREQQEARLLN